jgi:hypothetical protein
LREYQSDHKIPFQGTDGAKNRLINVLRAVIHRKTHESRFLNQPFIQMKKFNMQAKHIDFYPAERAIYQAIGERFLKQVNGNAQNIHFHWTGNSHKIQKPTRKSKPSAS